MEFKFEPKNEIITDDAIIQDLIVVYKTLKVNSLSMKDYDLSGKYSSTLVCRRFKTWNNALCIANIPYRQVFWTVEDLMLNIYDVWIKKGKQPTRRDMDNKQLSHISSGAYLRKYKSWNEALREFINYINKNQDNPTRTKKEINLSKQEHKTKRDINLRLRFLVMKRDNFKCVICGRSPAKDQNVELHVDHIIPYSKGGETVIENLQTLCSDCNLGKSNLT